MQEYLHTFTLTEPIHVKDAVESIRQYHQTRPRAAGWGILPHDEAFLVAAGRYEIIPGKWRFTYTLDKIKRLEKLDE